MRVGVLTGGGDCPGLNAVIRAVVRKGVEVYGHEFVGFRDGWRGPLEGNTRELGIAQVRGILPRGGTILGSSRTNPFKIDGGVEKIKENSNANYGYNAYSSEYEDLIVAGVIDPTKVTRTALQNAASIASLMLTTEAMVCDIPEEKPPAGGPGGPGGMGMDH